MPHYMGQIAYAPETWRALATKPEDRAEVLRALIEKFGGKLECFYFSLGEYDAVAIFEAPDTETASAVTLAAAMGGHLRKTKTTELLTSQQTLEVLRRATGGQFHRPGA